MIALLTDKLLSSNDLQEFLLSLSPGVFEYNLIEGGALVT